MARDELDELIHNARAHPWTLGEQGFCLVDEQALSVLLRFFLQPHEPGRHRVDAVLGLFPRDARDIFFMGPGSLSHSLFEAVVDRGAKWAIKTLSSALDVNRAAPSHDPLIFGAIQMRQEDVSLALLAAGQVDLSLASGLGPLPLHAASFYDAGQVVEEMLRRGADPNSRADFTLRHIDGGEAPCPRFTPLLLAAQRGSPAAVRALLGHADLLLQDGNGLDALDHAERGAMREEGGSPNHLNIIALLGGPMLAERERRELNAQHAKGPRSAKRGAPRAL